MNKAVIVLSVLILVACGGADPGPGVDAGSGDDRGSAYERICADVVCGDGRCVDDDGRPGCLCNDGARLVDEKCVRADPCEERLCRNPNQSVCRVVGGHATCECDPGAVFTPAGCVADPFPTCAVHADPGDDEFEPNDCPRDARPLVTIQPRRRAISPAGDADWYEIDDLRGFAIAIVASGDLPLHLDAFASDRLSVLAADHAGLATSTVTFQGGWGALVRVTAADATSTGDYELSVVALGADDCGNSVTQACGLSVAFPHSQSRRFEYPGDVDVLALSLPAGQNYGIELRNQLESSPVLVAELLSSDRVTVLNQASAGEIALLTGGGSDRYLRVSSSSPEWTGEYRLSVTPGGPDDHADGVALATPLTSPFVANGTLEQGEDVDVFSFPVVAGRSYVARVPYALKGLVDVRFVTASNAAASPGSLGDGNVYAIPNAGDQSLFLEVSSLSASTLGTSYSIPLKESLADDHGNTRAEGQSIATDGTLAMGLLETPIDTDVFLFDAQAGHAYRVTAAGAVATRVRVRAPGSAAACDFTYGWCWVTATAAGNYAVDVTTHVVAGAYTIAVEDFGMDEHGGSIANATLLTIPTAGTEGALQWEHDVDVFAFDARVGQVLVFSVPSADAFVTKRLRDSSGLVLAYAYDSSSSGDSLAWRFDKAGRYFVELESSSIRPVPYVYSLSDGGADDAPDTVTAARPIVVGGTALAGRNESANDLDVFTFDTAADHNYRVTSTAPGGGGLSVVVTGPTGTVLVEGGFHLTFLATGAGSCFVTVGSYRVGATNGIAARNYELAVTDLGPDDHGNTTTSASPLPFDLDVAGTLVPARESDYFAISPRAGQVLRITCTSVSRIYCTLRNALGVALAPESSSELTWKALDPSPLYLSVSGGGLTPVGALYTVRVAEVVDDHGDDRLHASALVAGALVAGSFYLPADVDAFSVNTIDGHIYRVSSVAGVRGCAMKVLDAAGDVIVSNVAGEALGFQSVGAGPVVVLLSPDPTAGVTGSPNYQFAVTDLGVDDHGGTVATSSPLPYDTEVGGELELQGDFDVFAINPVAGHVLRLACTARDCTLRNALGLVVATPWAPMAEISWKAPDARPVYLFVSSPSFGVVASTYTVRAIDSPDDHGDTAPQATVIGLGTIVQATFEAASDVDAFALQLQPGAYVVNALAASPPVVAVLSPSGASIGTSSTAPTTFSVPASGRYIVTVSGTAPAAGQAYSVIVSRQ